MMGAHRNGMEIQCERINLFKAVKKSRTKGMSYTEMLEHVFNYQQRNGSISPLVYFNSHFDRGLITVHMPYLKRDGVIKCSDGRYRCLGFVPKKMLYKP